MAEADLVDLTEDGAIATITVNRPDKLNALNLGVLGALHDAVEQVRAWENTRCVILTGAGDKAFVAGADIAEMKDMGAAAAREFSRKGHALGESLEALEVPVIAAVNGFALGGGCELALACDFIHASEKAKFGQPEVKLGVIPGFGGTQRLARRVGIARARELVFSGAMLDAAEAKRIGLVNEVHAPAELIGNVTKLASTIASMGPRAVAEAKAVLREGEEKPLAEANALETEAFARCFETRDQTEGMNAFLEKRAAKFTGA
ncbi:MAG TPA: enoyl-CoA hydratase-related protein [Sandaracinaceae bacterium LLY-WYZ-13_1]|nr:enoyl-CoA hydratase-related protein [Sandaracinaceae bacterium LLY-WYZ-13_1]